MSVFQAPIHSGFDAATTAADIVDGLDLTGKVAIVTGGYAGIGLQTARTLRAAGATVIVPARDGEKARRALQGLDIAFAPMSLMDQASIDAFAATFLESGQPLHMLVNSAGVMACPLVRNARGYESHFATNHLGHFQLTAQLWPALRKAEGARVVSVSSWGHRYSPVIFADPNFAHRDYDRWRAYGQSKTANVLFAVALDVRGRADGVRAFALHPGSIVGTDLKRYLSDEELRKAGLTDAQGQPIFDPATNLKTAEQGAATSVWCATSRQLDGLGGVYCENCDVSPLLSGAPVDTGNEGPRRTGALGVLPYAVDAEAAERLWTLSERLVA